MVFISKTLYYAQKSEKIYKPVRQYLRQGFIDHLRIHVKAGNGGSGLPRYGGIGGKGGDVFVEASEKVTLKHVDRNARDRNLSAESGSDSSPQGLIGPTGKDLIIKVPTGVGVYDENGIAIGEVNSPYSKLKIAEGGIGGCKETNYCGYKGQIRTLLLDLKLISDIALVGFPNAGKSTLLKTISRAAPKVAAYPFTTVKPNIGIMDFRDLRRITVGDLPGLIEGAHQNVGMGYKFLKHIERTQMLLFVVDVQGFQLSRRHVLRNCLETVILLNKEIELYKPDLLEMPAMLLINKMDTPGAEDTLRSIMPKLERLSSFLHEVPEEIRPKNVVNFEDIFKVSLLNISKNEKDLLKQRIRNNLDKCVSGEQFRKEDETPVVKLINQVKKETKKIAPTLV